MIDEELNCFLLEVNTNPGLEISSPGIASIMPRLVEDMLRLTVDDIFYTEFENGTYKNPFSLEGYPDDENIWEFVCNM